jgi:hypothetical protein
MEAEEQVQGEYSDAGSDGGQPCEGCEYAGQQYSVGSQVCMAGFVFECRSEVNGSHQWHTTGTPCNQESAAADSGGDTDYA